MKMVLLGLLLALPFSPARAEGQRSAQATPWQAKAVPNCLYPQHFWDFEAQSGVTQDDWDSLSVEEQRGRISDFSRHYRDYAQADQQLSSASSAVAEQNDPAAKQSVIMKTTTDADLAARIQSVKTFFGEDSPLTSSLTSRMQELSRQGDALESQRAAQKADAQQRAIQQENAQMTRAAQSNSASGLNRAYENSRQGPDDSAAAARAAGASSVGGGEATGGAMAAREAHIDPDGGLKPKAIRSGDPIDNWVKDQNARWFGTYGTVNCDVMQDAYCPQTQAEGLRRLQSKCSSDPAWCGQAKARCAKDDFQSVCGQFDLLNSMQGGSN